MTVTPLDTIRLIRTRKFPSIEVGLFAALTRLPEVRQALNISSDGDLVWEFVPSNTVGEPTRGVLYFNVGGIQLDQHGRPENADICNVCSLDLLTEHGINIPSLYPWMTEVFNRVRLNDINGAQLATKGGERNRHKLGAPLRDLALGVNLLHASTPMRALNYLALAFEGIFALVRAQEPVDTVWFADSIKRGVRMVASPRTAQAFDRITDQAALRANDEYLQGIKDVDRAINAGTIRTVAVPEIGRVEVVMATSASAKLGQAARTKKFGLAIQVQPADTHHAGVQIYSGQVRRGNTKGKLDLTNLAVALRRAECQKLGIEPTGNLNAAGTAVDQRWYLPEFRSNVLNGSLSADIAPSALSAEEIFWICAKALPECGFIADTN